MHVDTDADGIIEPTDQTYYYLQDDHYNVIGLVDETGALVERYAYDDYGFPTIRETIVTTPEHPFYVVDEGWVAASELEVGQRVVTRNADDEDAAVDMVILDTGRQDVYNIEVVGAHTYFVATQQLLVHNCPTTWQGPDGTTYTRVPRKKPGADGAHSDHIVQRNADGDTISVTHQVTRDGDIIHQHQTHVGANGTERRFPNEWIEFPDLGL